jgi:hypothetical protein
LFLILFLTLLFLLRRRLNTAKYRESKVAVCDDNLDEPSNEKLTVDEPVEASEVFISAPSIEKFDDDEKTIASSSSLIERQALHRLKLPPISRPGVRMIAETDVRAGRWKRRHASRAKRSSPGHASSIEKDISHAALSDDRDLAYSIASKPTLWRENAKQLSRRPPGGGHGQVDQGPQNFSVVSDRIINDVSTLSIGRMHWSETKFDASDVVTAFEGLNVSPVKHPQGKLNSMTPDVGTKDSLTTNSKADNLLLETFHRRVGSRRKRRPVTSGKLPGPGDWGLEVNDEPSKFDIHSDADNSPTRGPGASRAHFPSVIIKKVNVPVVQRADSKKM